LIDVDGRDELHPTTERLMSNTKAKERRRFMAYHKNIYVYCV